MTQNPVPADLAPPVPLRRRTLGRTILWSAVLFLSGAVSGWGLGLLCPLGHPAPPPLGPEPPIDQIVRAMTDELLLSPRQVQQVQQLYRDRAAALRTIRREVEPRFSTEYDKLEAGLKDILTPEQFARWRIRFDAARKRMLAPGRPGDAGTPDGPGPRRRAEPPPGADADPSRPPHGPPNGQLGGPPRFRPDPQDRSDRPDDRPPQGPPDDAPPPPQ
jgi:hypothetical protein